MQEKMQQFFGVLLQIVNDPSTQLETKIEQIVSNYIDVLSENPELPLFVLSEMKGHADKIQNILPVQKFNGNLSFVKQLQEKRPDINPIHFLMNILGMTVFPFVAKPAFTLIASTNKSELESILKERKELIPKWIKAMLKAR
jgi:hypothetical protein